MIQIVPMFAVLWLGLGFTFAADEKHSLRHQEGNRPRKLVVTAPSHAFVSMEGQRLEIRSPGILQGIVSDNGAVEVTDTTELGEFIQDTIFAGPFRGSLKVKRDGSFRYDAELNSLGTYKFSYKACSTNVPEDCGTAEVSLTVTRDESRPDTAPIVLGTVWDITEGEELRVDAPGFLMRDAPVRTANGNLPVIFSPDQNGVSNGDLNTNDNGGFTYQAPACWSGTEVFSYTVCYEDFDELCSQGITQIRVLRDPNRPDPPTVTSDTYVVAEGERLSVFAPGFLQNDNPGRGQRLYVKSFQRHNDFRGGLIVESDGTFEYNSILGVRGTFSFDYEACYIAWPCVDCRTGTVSIVVGSSPDKPDPSSLRLVDDTYNVEQLQPITGNVLDNDVVDSGYQVQVVDGGGLIIDRNGNVNEQRDSIGTSSYTYTVCYVDWPDVCSTGTVRVTIRPRVPVYSTRQQGRATGYLVRWTGREEHICNGLTPNVTLSCATEGEVNLLNLDGADINTCTRPVDSTTGIANLSELNCLPSASGQLYAECRDKQDNNSTRRQLTVTMHSEGVPCRSLDSTFHAVWLNTLCNVTSDPATSVWQNRGMECSGSVAPDGTGETLCYEYAVGSIAQPADVVMKSAQYQYCSYALLDLR